MANFQRRSGTRGTPTSYGSNDEDADINAARNRLLAKRYAAERAQYADRMADDRGALNDQAAALRAQGVAGLPYQAPTADPRQLAENQARVNFLANGGPRFHSNLPFTDGLPPPGGPPPGSPPMFRGMDVPDAKATVDAYRLQHDMPSAESLQAADAMRAAAGTGKSVASPYGTGSSTVVPAGQQEAAAVTSDTGVQRKPLNWQERLVAQYPELKDENSAHNAAFVKAFKDAGADPAKAQQIADNIYSQKPADLTAPGGPLYKPNIPGTGLGGPAYDPSSPGPGIKAPAPIAGAASDWKPIDTPNAAAQAGQTAAKAVTGVGQGIAAFTDQNVVKPVVDTLFTAPANFLRGVVGASPLPPYQPYTPTQPAFDGSYHDPSDATTKPVSLPPYAWSNPTPSGSGLAMQPPPIRSHADLFSDPGTGTGGTGGMSFDGADSHPFAGFDPSTFSANDSDDEFQKRLKSPAYAQDGQ